MVLKNNMWDCAWLGKEWHLEGEHSWGLPDFWDVLFLKLDMFTLWGFSEWGTLDFSSFRVYITSSTTFYPLIWFCKCKMGPGWRKAWGWATLPDSVSHLRGGAADLSLMTACSLGKEAGYFQEVPQPTPLSRAQLLLPPPVAGGWPWLHTSQASAFFSLVSPVGPDGCGINEASHLVWGVNPGVTFSSPCIVSPRAWSDLLR